MPVRIMACKDCRYGANQYTAWMTFCEKHWPMILMACAAKGITPEQMIEDAVEEYIHRYHPDFKRWVA